MSGKDKWPSFYFSKEKFILGCLNNHYSLSFPEWSLEENKINVS